MEYFLFAWMFLIVFFIFIVITRVFMNVANHVGERLGFADFFISLWRKIKKQHY